MSKLIKGGDCMDKNHLVEIAKTLKQNDKLKVLNIILDAFSNDENLDDVLSQTLLWCEKLCDYKK